MSLDQFVIAPRLKRLLFTAHRWLGLSCAIVLLTTASTGLTLMFQRELGLTGAAPLGEATASLRGLDAAVAAAADDPTYVPVFLSPPPDSTHAWQLVTMPRSGAAELSQIASVDPASGRILQRTEVRRATASVLLKVHMELLSGRTGHLIVILMGVGVVLLAVSGFTILSRRWQVLWSNPLRGRDRWRALHRWAGLAGSALILMWGCTGFLLLGRIVLEDWRSPAAPVRVRSLALGVPLEAVIRHPEVAAAGELFGIGLPTVASPDIEVTVLRRAAAPWRKYARFTVDRRSGVVVKRSFPEGQSVADALLAVADSIHKGQSDPLAIHYAYAVAVLFPVLIGVSGPVTWLRRVRKARRKA